MRPKKRVLGLVPLDDRPVSLSQTALLARSAGCSVLLPPRRLLGRARTPGRPDELGRWLKDNFSRARGWVVSLDMLAYGGLVASRTLAEPLDACLRRLDALERLKARSPSVPLYAFQAIRRKSVTVSSSADLADWARQHRRARPLAAQRRRNHLVNRRAARLCARGALDALSLLQEDATATGSHKREQTALLRMLARPLAAGRAALTAGTDEGGMVLLARLIRVLEGAPPLRLRLVFSSAAGARRIAPYEDRPIAASAAGQARALGAKVARRGPFDLELWIWCPDRDAGDLCFAAPRKTGGREARKFAARIAAAADGRRRVAVADLAYANGSDPELLGALSRLGALPRLSGFAAWNTAGNTLGAALAQGALGRGDGRALLSRLLDDWGYQSVVRGELTKDAARRKIDPWKLKPSQRRAAERALNAGLGRWAERVLRPHFPALSRRVKATLPWSRLFEAEVPWVS